MASPNGDVGIPSFRPPPPRARPPPPPPNVRPPPPFVRPPPPPLPPSPSPNNNITVIVIVFVSFVGLLLLALLAVALCCFIKKKKKKTVEETDIEHVDEHFKVKEAIVHGPYGSGAVMLDIEDDVHARKDEKVGEVSHDKSVNGNPAGALEIGASSSSGSNNSQLEHKA